MTDKLNDTVEILTQNLIQEIVDINSLNIAKLNQREAFLGAIAARPALLAKVNSANSEHLLKFAIEQNPMYFVYLTSKQYTEPLAQTFLYNRLTESLEGNKKSNDTNSYILKSTLVQKSLDDKITFIYTHSTLNGEELYYLDRELEVPVAIKSSFKITLKLTDAVKLINKLDTHITQLGELKIKTLLFDIINNQFKAYLNDFIEKNNAGYYTLCTSFSEIESGFATALQKVMNSYGITVVDFIVKQLAIPTDIQNKIENLSFEIRQRKADAQADNELAKLSLENYAAKLAINEKYPNTEPTLTEYEKDLALKRYLTKTGKVEETNIDHSINIQHRMEKADEPINKTDDIIPEITPKTNMFKPLFIFATILAGLFSVCLMFSDIVVGMIALGVFVAIFGVIAAVNINKFSSEKVELSVYENETKVVEETKEENSEGGNE